MPEVLARASEMGDTGRWKARQTTCATHAVSRLPKTTDEPSMAYCSTCWTLFTDAGHIHNPIDFDKIVDD
jgi:hypothetical protein